MSFLTRWLSRGSKQNSQVTTLGNGPDSEHFDSELLAFPVVTAESPQVQETYSVAEVSLPSEPKLQNSSDGLPSLLEQIPAKTQAMIDAELVNSDAWLSDIERGQVEWASQLAILHEKVASSQEMGDRLLLMLLSSYFDLEPKAALEESFPAKLLQRIEELFDVDDFKKVIEEKTRTRRNTYRRSVEYYMGEFVTHRWLYVQGINRFIDLIDKNCAIVESRIDALIQAEREHNPYAGGVKLSSWRGFTRKFAKDHLFGINPEDFFPEPIPRYLREYRAETIGVAGARFLWAILSAVKLLASPGGRSTSEIGIAFEKKLIDEISETYPTARIEPTPKTGDQGADVIMLVEGIKFVIQAKKYTGVVGNAAVQEVFAAKEYYEADYAIVVTNSRYTQSASVLANKIGVELTTAQDYLRKIQQLLV